MKVEAKVGLLAIFALLLVIGFAYLMGFIAPYSGAKEINVMYNYAGGIDEGSPVRVMGIKVGKVKKIEFDPSFKTPQGEEVKLKLVIAVENKAWSAIRQDSKFFINLAGVIGEKFLEISPGSTESGELESGAVVRGEDPPRVDQLISQSYGLAGKIIEVVEKNEGDVIKLIAQLNQLTGNINKTLLLLDKASKNKDVGRLLENSIKISDDLAYLTGKMRSEKAEKTYELIHKLLFRLEPLDGPALQKFFQKEGVRARVF